MVAAIELALQWNNVTGVYDASTAVQLVPIVVVSSLLGQVLWTFLVAGQSDDSDSSESSSSSFSVEEVEIIVN